MGDGCGVGAGAVVAGVGAGAVVAGVGAGAVVAGVGAGAVVAGEFPPRSVVAGNPAKVVRTLEIGT